MGGRVDEEEYYKKSEKKEARNRAENYTGGKTCTLSGTFVEPSPHVTSPWDSHPKLYKLYLL